MNKEADPFSDLPLVGSQQPVRIGLLGPIAIRVIGAESLVRLFKRLRLMGSFVAANPLQENSLRGHAAVGMVSDNRVQDTVSSGEIFVIEAEFGAAEEQERDHFFGREKTDIPMMLLAFCIENNQGWSPFYLKLFG